jgi:hydrogenase maturation protease
MPGQVLIIGFGNPGRGDDGAGPECIERLRGIVPAGVALDSDYQLTVEDSAAAAEYATVIFVDASRTAAAPFEFTPTIPGDPGAGFSSHSVSPEGVLGLTAEIFGRRPEAYTLGIRGYEWDELREGLSPGAEENLEAAKKFLTAWLAGRVGSAPREG